MAEPGPTLDGNPLAGRRESGVRRWQPRSSAVCSPRDCRGGVDQTERYAQSALPSCLELPQGRRERGRAELEFRRFGYWRPSCRLPPGSPVYHDPGGADCRRAGRRGCGPLVGGGRGQRDGRRLRKLSAGRVYPRRARTDNVLPPRGPEPSCRHRRPHAARPGVRTAVDRAPRGRPSPQISDLHPAPDGSAASRRRRPRRVLPATQLRAGCRGRREKASHPPVRVCLDAVRPGWGESGAAASTLPLGRRRGSVHRWYQVPGRRASTFPAPSFSPTGAPASGRPPPSTLTGGLHTAGTSRSTEAGE
jgi:hypothetical protein